MDNNEFRNDYTTQNDLAGFLYRFDLRFLNLWRIIAKKCVDRNVNAFAESAGIVERCQDYILDGLDGGD